VAIKIGQIGGVLGRGQDRLEPVPEHDVLGPILALAIAGIGLIDVEIVEAGLDLREGSSTVGGVAGDLIGEGLPAAEARIADAHSVLGAAGVALDEIQRLGRQGSPMVLLVRRPEDPGVSTRW
jgi:hypothetical protein